MIYLAAPFYDPDPDIRFERFESIIRCHAKIISEGYFCFAPVAHGYPASVQPEYNSVTEKYWLRLDLKCAVICRVLLVITLPGWEDSIGIKEETVYFSEKSKPIFYISKKELLKNGLPDCLRSNPEAVKSLYK